MREPLNFSKNKSDFLTLLLQYTSRAPIQNPGLLSAKNPNPVEIVVGIYAQFHRYALAFLQQSVKKAKIAIDVERGIPQFAVQDGLKWSAINALSAHLARTGRASSLVLRRLHEVTQQLHLSIYGDCVKKHIEDNVIYAQLLKM
jgi:hypothetical protein